MCERRRKGTLSRTCSWDHLRENEAADNHKTKWTPRRSVVSETEGKGHSAHESGEGRHHDGSETLEAGFMNCLSQTQSFVDSFEREINDKDSVLFHDTEQQEKADDAVEGQGRSKSPEGE